MEGENTAPTNEGDKLDSSNNGEDVYNDQKHTEGYTKSGSKVQINADETENEENALDQEKGSDDKQDLETENDGQEGTGQEQEQGVGEEQEKTEHEQEAIDQDQDDENNQKQNEETGQEQIKQEEPEEEEDSGYVEPPPPDPAAPLNLTDSQERLKPRFHLRPEQLAEIEQLWDLYQDYTPAYTDINGYITELELVYLLKCLLLMTYTPEQLQELIAYCVRPPHPQGHITFDQFVKMATIRYRDFPVEEELRTALQVLDTGKEGMINRDYFTEVLLKNGYKMNAKQLNNLIKEVDIRNDGTIGIEDVVGTMCVDLTTDDMFKSKDEEEEQNVEGQPDGNVVEN